MDFKALAEAALDVRRRAYAPYSGYPVGAAVLDVDGVLHVGCNVENASYPVGACAERNALAAMVAAGASRAVAVAVATRDGGSPCGMCRQALLEFAQDPAAMQVLCVSEAGDHAQFTLSQLLPHAFQLESQSG